MSSIEFTRNLGGKEDAYGIKFVSDKDKVSIRAWCQPYGASEVVYIGLNERQTKDLIQFFAEIGEGK